jgi:heterodisulfide reductase subunit D
MSMKLENFKRDIYKCINCRTCRYAYTDFPDLGFPKNCPAGEKWEWQAFYNSGKMAIAKGLLEGTIQPSPELAEILYKCPLCGNCKVQCENDIPTVEIGEAMRALCVEAGFGPLEEHRPLLTSIKNYDNPWQQPRAARDRWKRKVEKEGIRIKDASREKVDVLYYVGCTASYDPYIQKLAGDTARILSHAGIDFGILGKKERCCCSTPLRLGVGDLPEERAKENIESFNATGASLILTSCAGCYRTLKMDYPKFGELSADVLHTVEFVDKLIKERKIRLKEVSMKVTYHDPCHLAKHAEIIEPPRNVLKSIPGIEFVEMDYSREGARCCCAGGGVRTAFTDWAVEGARTRVGHAEEKNVSTLVSACPFCYQNIELGIKEAKSSLKILDIVELVSLAMEEK